MAEEKLDLNAGNPVYSEIEQEAPSGDVTGLFGCASCKRPFRPEQLTAVSQERWNFESALVVCPDCLALMKAQHQERIRKPDLLLATVWAFIIFLIATSALGALIWFNRSEIYDRVWGYIGCYLLIVPAFGIGKGIYYGSGRKDSLAQRLIAVGFTALCLLVLNYINQMSFMNMVLDIAKPDGHPLAYLDFMAYLTNKIFQPVWDLLLSDPFIGAAVIVGSVAGLAVAYLTSGAPRLHTRPFDNSGE